MNANNVLVSTGCNVIVLHWPMADVVDQPTKLGCLHTMKRGTRLEPLRQIPNMETSSVRCIRPATLVLAYDNIVMGSGLVRTLLGSKQDLS